MLVSDAHFLLSRVNFIVPQLSTRPLAHCVIPKCAMNYFHNRPIDGLIRLANISSNQCPTYAQSLLPKQHPRSLLSKYAPYQG